MRHGDTHDDDLLVICSLRRQAKVMGGLTVSHEDSTDEGWVLGCFAKNNVHGWLLVKRHTS